MTMDPSMDIYVPGTRRLKNTELVYPIVVGTVAFFLGKKASETQSHRWTVYVRGANNEDLTHIVQKVVFKLHESFPNPARAVTKPPFELTEHGWGEFEIGIDVYFQPDSGDPPITLFHRLKLYADDESQSTTKPVVSEELEEIVFSEPQEAFYRRVVSSMPTVQVPQSEVVQFVGAVDEAEDLNALQEMRQKVAQITAGLKTQLQEAPPLV